MKKGKIRKTRRSWPPPESDMEEDKDDDDPDGDMEGCNYCLDSKSFSPQLAWNAFYLDGNSLRNSWCLGKLCKDPGWEWFEEETVGEVTEHQEKVRRCDAATEELNKHSSEFSSSCVAVQFSSSSSQQTVSSGISAIRPSTFWRPWEDPHEDKAVLGDVVTSQKSLVTPPKPYFSSTKIATPSPLLTPQGRTFRKAKKRSAGDLAKRRQRLISFQLSHTPSSTPTESEPELSSLESGSWGGHPGTWRLDTQDLSPGIPLGQRSSMDDFSNQTNPHLLCYPPSPQSWWPTPGLMSSPSPAPSPPSAWLSRNMAPPSPAYCDGCQRWGNLLSVTVSQTRAY